MWLFLLAACQDSLGDRHELEGFRIAAVSAQVDGAAVSPRAAVLVDGHLWQDTPVSMAWSWTETGFDAEGPAPTLRFPEGEEAARLWLRVHHDDEVRTAFLDLPRRPATVSLEVEGPDFVQPGATAGFTGEVPADQRVRWMATAPHGRFTEQTRQITEWQAPDTAGVLTILALATDDAGATAFVARDVRVGVDEPGLWVGGRWLPGFDSSEPDVVVRFEADDAAPSGLRVTPDAFDPRDDLAGICGQVEPFDPVWMLDGRCTRSELVGRVWRVEPQ